MKTNRRTLTGLLVAACALLLAVPAFANGVDPDENHPEHWESPGVDCTKFEQNDDPGAFGEWGDIQEGEPHSFTTGQDFVLVIVKAGTVSDVHTDVAEGTVLTHSEGKAISHVIVCVGETPPTTVTTAPPTTPTTQDEPPDTTAPPTTPTTQDEPPDTTAPPTTPPTTEPPATCCVVTTTAPASSSTVNVGGPEGAQVIEREVTPSFTG